jgi:proteic killer suppression protein
MKSYVELTKNAEKDLRRLPRNVLILFGEWIETIEIDGYDEMKKIKGYRDHALKGKRLGQRSSSLTYSYRVIYEYKSEKNIKIIEVLEVNNHDY